MTLRRITNDKSVRYVSKDENLPTELAPQISTQERKILPLKNFHKTIKSKKHNKNILGEDFRMIKRETNYYFG